MKKLFRRIVSVMMVTAMVVTLIPALESVQADDEPYNLSEGRAVYASSANGGDTEDRAVDGKTNTRWQAATSDSNEWLYVDLGKKANIDHIYMHWEAAYAKYYKIETSDDEIEWTTAYEKKKGEAQHKTMAVSYKYTGTRADGDYRFSVNWTKVEDAHYKVYIDGEDNDHIAYAGGDNYRFTNHGGTQGDIRMSQGEHYMIVVAFNPDNNEELGRGVLDLDAQVDAQGDNGIEDNPADALKQTINKDELSVTEARYVRITCTQRATGYGASLFEFQVWGTGGSNKPPVDYGENLALNKTVKCSGTRDEWWMKDADGNIKPDAYDQVKPENAVDGSKDTAFTSYQGEDDQWIYVDLGAEYDIGRVITRFNEDAGKIYDIQTSKDAKHWTTIHREQKGFMNKVDNFTCFHEDVRFVRFLGYSKVESGSGFGIRELEVYEYKEGDSKENETIKDLPISQIVNNENGKGSYVVGEVKKELNKLPTFVNEEHVRTPIDSNSWWSSFMIKTYGNMAVIHPLKAQFSSKGLGTLLASQGYTDERKPQDLGVGYYSEKLMDFYLKPDSFDANSGYDRVENYGDFHVDVGLCDDEGLKMKSTLVKGSPYIFSEFYEDDTVLLSSSSIFKIDNKNGQRVLENAGDTYSGDHIVIHTQDDENFRAENGESDFLLCAPENTTFTAKNVGKKTLIKIQFESKDNAYISACGMHAEAQVEEYYQHAYNRVKDTEVTYDFNKENNKITTYYHADTDQLRVDLPMDTVLGFYPHQWKHESENCAGHFDTYKSIRGDMRMYRCNELSTTQQFAGLLPTFAKPNSSKLEKDKIKQYIKTVVDEIGTGPNADAYWQGKAVHPLAITALMADQIGEKGMRDQLLKDLKKIMVDWFTYSGGDDRCYLIYNKDWGTVYYPESAYGANAAICDHHFTYGYFLFGAAVLSTYDQDFYYQYKDMVEIMLRDYADPEDPRDDGNMFCKFRAFDQYSGHSWAGGYADNDDGNNQESASESLFSWVGMYLWGEVTKQDKYIDAGAYGFTTEMEAVKQYWFDYDGDNWLDSFPFQGTGQVYGASYSYGTFFGGQPLYIYGIQWLPISEYLTNYGMDQEKCARAYQGLLDETDDAREKVMINANIVAEQMRQQGKSQEEIDAYLAQEQHTADTYPTADTGWQHITWPFLSQTDPDAAYEKFTAGVNGVQKEDRANTYWFISAMDSIGYKTTDYVITGATISGSVYKKVKDGNTVYTGEIWNPTQEVKTTYVVDSNSGEKIGKVKVKAGSLVQFEIDTAGGFDLLLGNEESGGGEEETTTPAEDETVQPPADVKDWIPDSRFNLALNKEVYVSSIYKNEGSQDASVLVDGNLNSPYVSTDWDNTLTEDSIIIDLGENYHPSDINKIAMQFKNDQAVFCNQYTVEVSADDFNYQQCATKTFENDQYVNGFISFDIDTMPAISSVRYVMIRMIGHKNWGFQIREAAVLTRNSKAT
ncbi:MAG: discoidin domain-containing protein, partial [Eubacterium sp.]|nr:discoidin domain-containing protein [Eubacterium sp.]